MGLLLNGAGNLVTKDMEQAEAANAFFTLICTVNTNLQELQAPEARDEVWSKKDFPSVEVDQARKRR